MSLFKVGDLVRFNRQIASTNLREKVYRVHRVKSTAMVDLKEFGQEGPLTATVWERWLKKATDAEIAAEVVKRIERPVNFSFECPDCAGSGLRGPPKRRCRSCEGTGKLYNEVPDL